MNQRRLLYAFNCVSPTRVGTLNLGRKRPTCDTFVCPVQTMQSLQESRCSAAASFCAPSGLHYL